MPTPVIAVIGERDLAKKAHEGIEASLEFIRAEREPRLRYSWVGTAQINAGSVAGVFAGATGLWCAPGSPYESTEGALRAIRHARETGRAFLGTCGGFQHALMEFAQNVLHRPSAHAELAPDAPDPLIAKLTCSLVGARGRILADPATNFAALLGGAESVEGYHCNYGLNPALEKIFAGSDLAFVAHDEAGQVRAFQLAPHPFFIGTLFQPERRALEGGPAHPLVQAFIEAAAC